MSGPALLPVRLRMLLRRAGWSGGSCGIGGSQAVANSATRPVSHGQSMGRCMRTRRAEVEMRAGMLINLCRMVPMRALARSGPVRVRMARVKRPRFWRRILLGRGMYVMPKKINFALRDRAVRLVPEHRSEYPSLTAASAAVARQVGVGHESVRRWVLQADIDDETRDAVTSAEHAEIKKLKAENNRLREDVAILRAAPILFVGELDPRSH